MSPLTTNMVKGSGLLTIVANPASAPDSSSLLAQMLFLQLLWVLLLWTCCTPLRRTTLGQLEPLHPEVLGNSLIPNPLLL